LSKKDAKRPDKAVKQPEKPPADAGKDSETEKKDVRPQIPYNEDTGKYEVAKAFLTGENNRKKLMKQPGVKKKGERRRKKEKGERRKEKNFQ
jgi:hypothetical protein